MIKLITFMLLVGGLISCSNNEIVTRLNNDSVEEQNKKTNSYKLVKEASVTPPKGTQLLPNSKKTGYSNELSPFFIKNIEITPCQSIAKPSDYKNHNKLTEIYKTDSTLSINFSLMATCGSDFLCEVEIKNNNCLNLIYHQYNSEAFCDCCYGLKFNFNINEFYNPELEDFPKIKFIEFNGEERTPFKQ